MSKYEELMQKNSIESIKKTESIDVLSEKLDALLEYQGLRVRNIGRGSYEVIKDVLPDGDYTRPILIPENGIETEIGKWYYIEDPDFPHEAKQNAFITRDDFSDPSWFDFV